MVNTSLIFSDAGATVQGAGKVTVGAVRPERYALHPNMPNPFNPATQIRFDLPIPSPLRLPVDNSSGRELERLVERWTRTRITAEFISAN